ncbi:hypothetical protein Skr01_21500 [Sphaerisporangium krabiense]|nr:hypothetical protein Skr01_21500 [Sphaerisporangium krabiense]
MGDRVRQRDRPMRLGEGIGAGPFEIGAGQAGDCPAPTHFPHLSLTPVPLAGPRGPGVAALSRLSRDDIPWDVTTPSSLLTVFTRHAPGGACGRGGLPSAGVRNEKFLHIR